MGGRGGDAAPSLTASLSPAVVVIKKYLFADKEVVATIGSTHTIVMVVSSRFTVWKGVKINVRVSTARGTRLSSPTSS